MLYIFYLIIFKVTENVLSIFKNIYWKLIFNIFKFLKIFLYKNFGSRSKFNKHNYKLFLYLNSNLEILN